MESWQEDAIQIWLMEYADTYRQSIRRAMLRYLIRRIPERTRHKVLDEMMGSIQPNILKAEQDYKENRKQLAARWNIGDRELERIEARP